jgi:ribosomal protein S18 acetylase RimI-like enzyme
MEILKPISKNDLNFAANLIFQADKEYYDIFSDTKDQCIAKMKKMYLDERTDFSKVKAIYFDKNMIGSIVYYSASERFMRHSFDLPYLKSRENIDLDALKKFNKNVPNFSSDGLYLSRIAIAPEFQGRGFCQKSIDLLGDIALSEGYEEILMHVRGDNISAIKCYIKAGFININPKDIKSYKVYKKKL